MNRARRTSPPGRTASSLAIIALAACAPASCLMLAAAYAQETPETLSVPAIGVPAASEDPETEMAPRQPARDTAQPTLPGGKLPQYQLTPDLRKAESDDTIENARLRFLLALPAEPMLVEANITIDGEPFRKKREQRVRATLNVALTPETEPPAAPETEMESVAPLNAEKPATAVIEGGEAESELADAETNDASRVPAYQSASSDAEKLRRYIASIGREPSLEEVRWFFINRLDGPTLLLLKDHFQAFRAAEMPVFHILDRNRDGAVSSEEIAQAVESFRDCDLNRDDIVDYLEINEAANDPRRRSANLVDTGALLHLLPTAENAAEVYAELLTQYDSQQQPAASLPARFDANMNGRWEPEEQKTLRTMPADITLTVNFDSAASGDSSLSVSEESLRNLAEHQIAADIVNSSIVLHRPDCEVWLSAIHLQAGDQISLGAVSDGYPMLPVLDPNDDGRFTVRELRGVTDAIRQFDTNGDGQILKGELRPAIRVCFGMRASVHQALAGVRSVHPAGTPTTTGPEWFVRMDRNNDNDLTRQEFPGTDAQFDQLDADKDELVSAGEALEYDRKNSPQQKQTPPPKTENNATPPKESPGSSDN